MTSVQRRLAKAKHGAKPVAEGLTLYKYVDPRHANLVAAGSLRVGSLKGYTQMEGARGDPGEGSIVHEVRSHAMIGGSGSPIDAALERKGIGIVAPGSTVHLKDCRIVETAADVFCLCLARRPDIAHPDGRPQVVFAVHGVDEVIRLLIQQHAEFEGPWQKGWAKYQGRYNDLALNPDADFDPYLKPVDLAWEEEFRILFKPRNRTGRLEVVSGPNRKIAKLHIRRIGNIGG